MSKAFKRIGVLLVILLMIAGCKESSVQVVSTYDEEYDTAQKERYRELHDRLYENYADNLSDMKSDASYEEYTRLYGIYGVGNFGNAEARINNFTGRVHLDKQIIEHDGHTITFDYTDEGVVILNNDTDLLDDTFVRMVDLAEEDAEDGREHNLNLLATGIWLPIVTFVAGVVGWFKPEWVWYLEGGFRNKGAEPSDTAIVFAKIQAVVAFGLTIFLIFLLYSDMM